MPALASVDGKQRTTLRPNVFRKQGYLAHLYDASSLRAFYLDTANRQAVLHILDEMHAQNPIRLLSIDVFDTALLRETKSEAERFMEASMRFVEQCSKKIKPVPFDADDAFMARVMAAKSAYALAPLRHGNREGVLDDVAAATCDLLGCPKLKSDYVDNELAYELAATQLNPLVADISRKFPGLEVVYVSDMYLTRGQIQALLCRPTYPGQPKVFSSADGYGSKRTGQVFRRVESATGHNGPGIVHMGDSLLSDYQMPIVHGWRALHLPLPEGELAKRRMSHSAVMEHFKASGIPMSNYLQFNA